jgi:phytoene dehydrogenase-like protein
MAATPDIVIIGGGINGLTCAAFLAKRGLKPLVLERQAVVGGCSQTAEIAPGFRAPILAHAAGPLRADVIHDLQLRRHGLEFIPTDIAVVAIGDDDRPLVLSGEEHRTVNDLRVYWSPHDADHWPSFAASMAAIGHVVGTLFTSTPPPVDEVSGRDLWSLMRALRAVRALE